MVSEREGDLNSVKLAKELQVGLVILEGHAAALEKVVPNRPLNNECDSHHESISIVPPRSSGRISSRWTSYRVLKGNDLVLFARVNL